MVLRGGEQLGSCCPGIDLCEVPLDKYRRRDHSPRRETSRYRSEQPRNTRRSHQTSRAHQSSQQPSPGNQPHSHATSGPDTPQSSPSLPAYRDSQRTVPGDEREYTEDECSTGATPTVTMEENETSFKTQTMSTSTHVN